MDKQLQEKLATVHNTLVQSAYVPAFVQLYNEKAAAAKLPTLTTEAEVIKAIETSQWLQEVKQAQAKTVKSPLNAAHEKLAGIMQGRANSNIDVNTLAKVANDIIGTPEVAKVLQSVVG